jgi:GT2 family glycosyltransferase
MGGARVRGTIGADPVNRPEISVVVLTHGDRRGPLNRLLSTLAYQSMPFELVVVRGPGAPDVAPLLAEQDLRALVVACAHANVSAARNVGIAASAGRCVVFIDDDAAPIRHDWLRCLTAPLARPGVGAVGGAVLHRDTTRVEFDGGATTVSGFQCFTGADCAVPAPDGRPWIARVPGGNCAIAREALDQVGGFDEAYAYYLDEADLCLRVIAAGYSVAHADDAMVRHDPVVSAHGAAGHRDRYPIARSDAYFVLRHVPGSRAARVWCAVTQQHRKHFITEGPHLRRRGELDTMGLLRSRLDAWHGLVDGIRAGLTARTDIAPVTARGATPIDARPPRVQVVVPDVCRAPHEGLGWLEQVSSEGCAVTLVSGTNWVWRPGVTTRPDTPPAPATALAAGEPWLVLRAERALQWGTHLMAMNALWQVVAWPGDDVEASLVQLAIGSPVVPAGRVAGTRVDVEDSESWLADGPPWWAAALRERPGTPAALASAMRAVAHTPTARPQAAFTPWTLAAAFLVRWLEPDVAAPRGDTRIAGALGATILPVVRHCLRQGATVEAEAVGVMARARLAPVPAVLAELDYHLGRAALARGDDATAHARYESVRATPRTLAVPPEIRAGACFHLGMLAQGRGDAPAAAALARECLDWCPAHGAARRLLAEVTV